MLNAVGALVMGHELGIGPDALQEALEGFSGASRRLELIADTAGVLVFDDYAHHPTEVRAALEGARQRVGDRRLWAVIEPHTFARTRAMFDEYASAFKSADEVVVADVFAARDPDTTIVSAEELADAIEGVSAVPAIATGTCWRPPTTSATSSGRGRPWSRSGSAPATRSRRGSPKSSRSRRGRASFERRAGVLLTILLTGAVAVVQQGLVRLVEGSGAAQEPAVILILLLAAFLGLLTGVATRALNLPGAVAPTVVVLAWTLAPVIFSALPWEIFQTLGGDAALSGTDSLALAMAAVAAAITLGVQIPNGD